MATHHELSRDFLRNQKYMFEHSLVMIYEHNEYDAAKLYTRHVKTYFIVCFFSFMLEFGTKENLIAHLTGS